MDDSKARFFTRSCHLKRERVECLGSENMARRSGQETAGNSTEFMNSCKYKELKIYRIQDIVDTKVRKHEHIINCVALRK